MDIRPFRGWRPRPDEAGAVNGFLAPPYDILSADDKQALLAGGVTNVVAVDLPHVPARQAGPDAVYRQAAELLRSWQASGEVLHEPEAAVYVYRQTYAWAGKSHTRLPYEFLVFASRLGITAQAQLMYVHTVFFDHGKGLPFVGLERIAERMGMSRKSADRGRRWWIASGLLRRGRDLPPSERA